MHVGGNQVYETFMFSENPIYLGVVEATPLVKNSLGKCKYEEKLTVCLIKEAGAADESALSYQLSRRLTDANASFTIINEMTIVFVADTNDNILLMDSHLHISKASLLAKSKRKDNERAS